MSPYRAQRMHALTQLNYEARLNFVTMMCERHQGDDQWLKRWMFTDEATFQVVAESTRTTASFGEQRIHMSHTNSKEPALNRMCGAE